MGGWPGEGWESQPPWPCRGQISTLPYCQYSQGRIWGPNFNNITTTHSQSIKVLLFHPGVNLCSYHQTAITRHDILSLYILTKKLPTRNLTTSPPNLRSNPPSHLNPHAPQSQTQALPTKVHHPCPSPKLTHTQTLSAPLINHPKTSTPRVKYILKAHLVSSYISHTSNYPPHILPSNITHHAKFLQSRPVQSEIISTNPMTKPTLHNPRCCRK